MLKFSGINDIEPDETGDVRDGNSQEHLRHSFGVLRIRTDNHLSLNLSPNSSLDGGRGNA